MAMKVQLRGGIRIMWKGEDVIRRNEEFLHRLPAMRQTVSVRRHQGGVTSAGVIVDRTACWGAAYAAPHVHPARSR